MSSGTKSGENMGASISDPSVSELDVLTSYIGANQGTILDIFGFIQV